MINAIIGGVLIGVAVSLMMLFNGKVTGISGILSGTLSPKKQDTGWRVAFLAGLFVGALILKVIYSEALTISTHTSKIDFAIAGLLVGFGTLLGNGCTSGHGVCGISRFSVRSILATMTFISFGIISVLLFKFLRGEL